MILSAQHLFLNYGMRQIFEDASLFINEGDKIGVVGLNGATHGKSSNAGALFIKLQPKEERLAKGIDIESMRAEISGLLQKHIPEASTFVLMPPAVQGIGAGGDAAAGNAHAELLNFCVAHFASYSFRIFIVFLRSSLP